MYLCYCDICGSKMDRNIGRLKIKKGRLEIEVMTAVDKVWNGGQVCHKCIKTAISGKQITTQSAPHILPRANADFIGFNQQSAPVQPSAVVSREEIGKAIINGLPEKSEHPNIDWLRILDELEALQLPKPQTVGRVDLSGVQRWTFNQTHMRKHFDGEFVRVSDLRRLVAPVQPSAVVMPKDEDGAYLRFSEWLAWCGYPEYNTKKTWAVLAEEYADRIISTQLPQPVAPVQGGGVELELLKRFKDFVVETILPNARNVSLDVVEELAWSSIVQEVDAHLTSRTEGK